MNVHLPHNASQREESLRLSAELQQAVAAEGAATKSLAGVFRVEVLAGKLLTESGTQHLYSFLLDAVVPITDDVPGELHIGGKVYPCRVVAVTGLRATVVLETAPARVIERAVLVVRPWLALTRLGAALARSAAVAAAGPRLSAELFAGASPDIDESVDTAASQAATNLNLAQRAALTATRRHAVAAIVGPANSGKTHVLSRIAAASLAAGQRVLVLAPTNTAIDGLLRALLESSAGAAYKAGDVIRSGASADAAFQRAYPFLAPAHAESRLRADLDGQLGALDAERAALTERDLALRVLQKAVALARQAVQEREAVQSEVEALLARREAAAPEPSQPEGLEFLRERWDHVWQRALRFTGRTPSRARNRYREDSERRRQDSYRLVQQLGEAQDRLADKQEAAARLHESLVVQLAQYDLTAAGVDAACEETAARLNATEDKRRRILDEMRRVRRAARARARLVASTVTQALIAEDFDPEACDVVLIDDAHRIPLPHLFWAAGLARSRVVLTTEEAALPPWHCAPQAVARRWLGRSFAEYLASLRLQEPAWVVRLSERYHVRPQVAEATARWLADQAVGGARVQAGQRAVPVVRHGGRRRLPVRGHTAPLDGVLAHDGAAVLVDTAALKPWCEVVPQAGRLNLGSALAAVALAERLIAATPAATIALVAPYAAQARLLLHVARDRQVSDAIDIYAPPALPSQTADIVILDTAETPGRFAWSALDESRPDSQAHAFLGSVCARARQSVMIVAHWKHVRDSFGTQSRLRRILGEAVEAGLAASAAELVPGQPPGALPRVPAASGENGENAGKAGGRTGWRLLLQDIQAAERHLTLWSTQLEAATVERVLHWLPSGLLERGAVRVVTLPQAQRSGQSGQSPAAFQLCEQVGLAVEQRSGLAANLVIVDDRIAWSCTFPPLGPGSRGAELRRIASPRVARVLRQLLRESPGDAVTQDAAAFMPYTEAASLLAGAVARPPERAPS